MFWYFRNTHVLRLLQIQTRVSAFATCDGCCRGGALKADCFCYHGDGVRGPWVQTIQLCRGAAVLQSDVLQQNTSPIPQQNPEVLRATRADPPSHPEAV